MPSPVLTPASTLLCPHGGVASLICANGRVLVSGAPIATVSDSAFVTGCTNEQAPCASIAWNQGASRVLVGGVPAAIQHPAGLAVTAVGGVNGQVTVAATVQRVSVEVP